MTRPEIETVRRHLAGLEAVLAKSNGGWADEEALLEFRRLCWAALLVVRDPECQQQIDFLIQFAKDLYSDRAHHRWDIGPVFGADILRRKIRSSLRACRERMNVLEGARYGKRWRDLRAAAA